MEVKCVPYYIVNEVRATVPRYIERPLAVLVPTYRALCP